ARNPALDREITERAAAGKTQLQGFAVRQRHRCIRCDRASRDVGVARPPRERDPNRAFPRGERGAEWTDFNSGGEQGVSDQTIGGGKPKPIYRAAWRQPITLG